MQALTEAPGHRWPGLSAFYALGQQLGCTCTHDPLTEWSILFKHNTERSCRAQCTCMGLRICQVVQPVHALHGLSPHCWLAPGLLCRVLCHCGIVDTELCFTVCAGVAVQGADDLLLCTALAPIPCCWLTPWPCLHCAAGRRKFRERTAAACHLMAVLCN